MRPSSSGEEYFIALYSGAFWMDPTWKMATEATSFIAVLGILFYLLFRERPRERESHEKQLSTLRESFDRQSQAHASTFDKQAEAYRVSSESQSAAFRNALQTVTDAFTKALEKRDEQCAKERTELLELLMREGEANRKSMSKESEATRERFHWLVNQMYRIMSGEIKEIPDHKGG